MPMFVPLRLDFRPLTHPNTQHLRLSRFTPRLSLPILHTAFHRMITTTNTPGRTLKGSCQCGNVEFTLQSQAPVPYQLCACSICRKVGGYSGSVNLGGIADTLKVVKGEGSIKKYNAVKDRGTANEAKCSSERNFCGNCSTMLWLWDHHWPELIHPFASAIDSELPEPDEMVCIMEESKPKWVRWPEGNKTVHKKYGGDSLEGWHKKKGLFVE